MAVKKVPQMGDMRGFSRSDIVCSRQAMKKQ
jgi:hypothetical protein